ncbi:MAG: hypothetical protein IPL35_05995 [Sphingobacteriales bacterium]|nr:hypothetical protein [Sphingobacteriales bacterium]
MRIILLVVVYLSGFAWQCTAQNNWATWRCDTLRYRTDTLRLDTLALEPFSEYLWLNDTDTLQRGADYRLHYETAQLYFIRPFSGALSCCYRVRYAPFATPYFHKDRAALLQSYDQQAFVPTATRRPTAADSSFIRFGGLEYSGSLSRGIAFGNRQDATVSASLDLRLSGQLDNGIEVLANISDTNIPFQMQGNTQQLQDFERIFIQLRKGGQRVVMGDFDVLLRNSRFLPLQRKMQGALVEHISRHRYADTLLASVAVAAARGRFMRQSFQGIEGNQGPYKLRGQNNELFILVLSGTERIYIDGNLLLRAEDYQVDYNLGEIIFTSKQLITKDKRIVVEFEYAERNYPRYVWLPQLQWKKNKWRAQWNYYTERDAKNNPLLQSFNAAQRNILQQSGDSTAYALSEQLTPYDANKILYYKKDTVFNGKIYNIYKRATAVMSNDSLYQLSFTELGAGKGNYILITNNLNGRSYEWIAPDSSNQEPRGTFEPLWALIAPFQQQISTATLQFSDSTTTARLETAWSSKDLNTLSDKDKDDNEGTALRADISKKIYVNKEKKIYLQASTKYDANSTYFQTPEPFLPPEFNRNWNIIYPQKFSFRQQIAGELAFFYNNFLNGSYQAEQLQLQGYKGTAQTLQMNCNTSHIEIKQRLQWLKTNQNTLQSSFVRPTVQAVYRFGKTWSAGLRYASEKNRLYRPQTDSLLAAAFHFTEQSIWAEKKISFDKNLKISYIWRDDKVPEQEKFALAQRARQLAAEGAWVHRSHQWRGKITYRRLEQKIPSDSLQNAPPRTLLASLNYHGTWLKEMADISANYEAATGQQQRLEEAYYEVPAGQGTHILLPSGNFVPVTDATRDTARFRLQWLPTNLYDPSNNVTLSYALTVNPKNRWSDAKNAAYLRFISRFSLNSNVESARALLAAPQMTWLLPVGKTTAQLLGRRFSQRHRLLYKHLKNKWQSEYYYAQTANTLSLLSGTDDNDRREQGLFWQRNANKIWTWSFRYAYIQHLSSSTAYEERNFRIQQYKTEPACTYQWSKRWRVGGSYRYQQSENTADQGKGERATHHTFQIETRYAAVQKGNLTARLSFSDIAFSDRDGNIPDALLPLSYAMLEGLQNGKNYALQITGSVMLPRALQLSISYEGRKNDRTPQVVHSARAEIRAIF